VHPGSSLATSTLRIAVAVALVAALAIGAIAGLVIIHPWSSVNQPGAAALAVPSLDPDAPALPVPGGSTLLNAQVEGSGSAAYRIAAWQSAQGYDATVAFYSGLADSRWQRSGSPSSTLQATDFTFSDSSGLFASAKLEVDRTDPVRIEVRFLPPGGPPAQSFAPGPTIAFNRLPVATALPDGFPTTFVPAGATVVDASSIGTTYFVVFAGSVDPGSYQSQIATVAKITGTAIQSGAAVIDFTYDGNPGEAIVNPASGQVSVQATK
jgi:hypothetical protein